MSLSTSTGPQKEPVVVGCVKYGVVVVLLVVVLLWVASLVCAYLCFEGDNKKLSCMARSIKPPVIMVLVCVLVLVLVLVLVV